MKIVISPYLGEKIFDFDEILYTAADFELDECHIALIPNEKVALDRLIVQQNVFLVLKANVCSNCCILLLCCHMYLVSVYWLFCVDSAAQPLLSQLFKASDDEWECKDCCVRNIGAADLCIKCKASRPCDESHNSGDIAKVTTIYVLYNLYMFMI